MTDNKARRLTVVRTSSDALRLGEGELVHVGVDVHKATYHVAIYSGSRGLLAHRIRARPPPPRGGLLGRGHRHLQAAHPGRPGGQVRPARLPPADPACREGATPPSAS